MRHARFVFALLTATLLTGVANAQVLYGNLIGNVTDPQQAAVASATVTLNSPSTGYTSSADFTTP